MRTILLLLSLPALTGVVLGQDNGGWRREPETQSPAAPDAQTPETPRPPEQPYTLPPVLTVQPGAFVTVRVNEWLSSDRNEPGDGFSATLVKPIVVDGFVVAHRGQTIGGRIVEAQKAQRGQESRLGLQLTDLTVADGRQIPVITQLVGRTAPRTPGLDAGTIVGTTAAGAAIGAIAGRGIGAAIGAVAGLAAGGVLTSRGRQTMIYPETVLTFRLESAVDVPTERSPQAFHAVEQQDYERAEDRGFERRPYPPRRFPPPPPCWHCGPYYGPRVSVFYGPRYHWGPRVFYAPWFW